MAKHCENAAAVAKYLEDHPGVAWVNYAGLPSNASYAMHQIVCPKGAGAVFTFGVKGGYEAGKQLCSELNLFSLLANIGDTRSLVIHPASTTHRQLTPEQRTMAGAGDDVIRLSIGIEDASDLIADLDQALARVG
jgi:O-acetylhomoserine (thiol)-lyase